MNIRTLTLIKALCSALNLFELTKLNWRRY